MEKIKFIIPPLITLAAVLCFASLKLKAVQFYPPVVNLFMFIVFFISLFSKKTIIQRGIILCNGADLKPVELTYTRNLTCFWTAFLFLNFLISLLSIFISDNFWIFYNGFLSYFLTGLIFAFEYLIRIRFKKRHGL